VQVRTLGPDEAGLHREVRLRALRDAPDSFGGTIEKEASEPLEYWEALTKSVSDAGRNVLFLACEDAKVHGMAYGLRDRESSDGARVGGMWVDPLMRRRGVGRQIMSAVIDWARVQGLTHIGLWAPVDSAAAIGRYRQAGFRETEKRGQLRVGSALGIVEMARDL
jgi:GNAT superfamily N-acetyltransferase